ncbi:MAG: glycoside hydrolase family 15 protein [Nitrososphaerales archaeon]
MITAPSLYLSNWQDIVAIWQARRLAVRAPLQAPGLRELHHLGRGRDAAAQNHIVDHCGFMRDETGRHSYTRIENAQVDGWFESVPPQAGILVTRYGHFDGADVQPRCELTRSYAAVPRQPFLVVRYTLRSTAQEALTFDLLDQLHLRRDSLGTPVHAWYDAGRRALIADLSAIGLAVVALGALEPPDGFQVADDADADPASPTCSGWRRFNRDGLLPDNDEVEAADVSVAFQQRVTVDPGSSRSVFFYLAVGADVVAAQAACDLARARSGEDWFAGTSTSYDRWLHSAGRTPSLANARLDKLAAKCLICIKNAQNPVLGTIPATTNPLAYRYFTWARDAAITAMALDAAGHADEAERFWRWMASVQRSDGRWSTRFSAWDGSESFFSEPEDDSLGQFIVGVWRHYELTGNAAFRDDLWPAARRAADRILATIAPNGLGAADCSIWEENPPEHNSFTQAWDVAGLRAAQWLAEARGETGLADWYAGGPASIVSALNRSAGAQPAGMWNSDGYFNRAVNADGTPRDTLDSSSLVLLALGVVDPQSPRAGAHAGSIRNALTKDRYGLARYPGDRYYFDKPYDPAGNEAERPEPSWPQMSMWLAVHEAIVDDPAEALARLRWYAKTCGLGLMPPGEAVDNLTHQSVPSTMCEPLTAAAYVLAALVYAGDFDLRVGSPVQQAGTRARLELRYGTTDAAAWRDVPYFTAVPGGSPLASARRCYLANDDKQLFVRLENIAEELPAFGADPRFAIRIYAGEAAGAAAALPTGLDGQSLRRLASVAVERRSDEDRYRRWIVTGGRWTEAPDTVGTLPPQWDPATGCVEATIPLNLLGDGGQWRMLTVALAVAGAGGALTEPSPATFHYRISTGSDPAIYGNDAG